ncbi:hypothetical protein BDN67DRAFT_642479 [Paxillus ammoniavirescens]|nr:hypothetical protein BDN67DRAFT_642479 [Paxillus ammoniavirescens]
MVFRHGLTMLTILVLCFRKCHASVGMLSWVFANNSVTQEVIKPAECETMRISTSSPIKSPSTQERAYYLLAFEPGGIATTSLVGLDASSLHWQVRHPAGSQLFLALVDSLGRSFGVLPTPLTVTPGSKHCQITPKSPRDPQTTQPKISSSVFDHLVPCGTWNLSISGGRAPYTVSILSLGSGTMHNFSVPFGEVGFSYTNRGEITGQVGCPG